MYLDTHLKRNQNISMQISVIKISVKNKVIRNEARFLFYFLL